MLVTPEAVPSMGNTSGAAQAASTTVLSRVRGFVRSRNGRRAAATDPRHAWVRPDAPLLRAHMLEYVRAAETAHSPLESRRALQAPT